MPPYICIPNQPNEFAGTGYLSSSYGAFSLGSDPASSGFKVRDLNLPGGVDEARFARRQQALNMVNQKFTSLTSADNVGAMETFYERAYNLLGSAEAKQAFDLSKEDDKMKDAYGKNQAGQRLLMARRSGGSRLPPGDPDLRRLGHAPGDYRRDESHDAAARPGAVAADHLTSSSAVCSTPRW